MLYATLIYRNIGNGDIHVFIVIPEQFGQQATLDNSPVWPNFWGSLGATKLDYR